MDMDERKIKILQAIIHDYIETAEPVGSRTIAKKYDLGISSATIRNEMADLEEMGYLEQIHSSSGRKPSDKGYRLYVDKLMQLHELSPIEEYSIRNHMLSSALYEIDKVIKQASAVLAELTNLTCVVRSPSVKKSCIKSVQLLDLDKNSLLAVVVTDTGIIKNNVIKLKNSIEKDGILKLNNILNSKLDNLEVELVNLQLFSKLENEIMQYSDILSGIIPIIYEILSDMDSVNVYSEGTTNIFNYPEYNDIQKAKSFLSLINDKVKMVDLISSDDNISIKIGEENFIEDAKDCTVISGIYGINDRPLGSIGVIGPTRMPYSKVISIVATIIDEINKTLSNDEISNK